MSESTAFELPQIFDISSVSDVKSNLTLAMGSSDSVPLDGGAVQRVDASGLQLLVGFRDEARRRGVETGWAGASGALVEAAKTIGMFEVLGLDAAPQD